MQRDAIKTVLALIFCYSKSVSSTVVQYSSPIQILTCQIILAISNITFSVSASSSPAAAETTSYKHNRCTCYNDSTTSPAGPQNPTPTSTLARAGNRLTRVSKLHLIQDTDGNVSLANGRGRTRLACLTTRLHAVTQYNFASCLRI